jgi:hypothetical protein
VDRGVVPRNRRDEREALVKMDRRAIWVAEAEAVAARLKAENAVVERMVGRMRSSASASICKEERKEMIVVYGRYGDAWMNEE